MQSTVEINGKGCLTLLTEVTGQAVVQVLVELSTVSSLQPSAQTKVRQLHMTLERKHTQSRLNNMSPSLEVKALPPIMDMRNSKVKYNEFIQHIHTAVTAE